MVMSEADAWALVCFLFTAPHGVTAMSPDIENLVQTSINLGVIETKRDMVEITFLIRSSIDSCKMALASRIAALASLAGMGCSHTGGYPGWRPDTRTSLVKIVLGIYEHLYGGSMSVKAMHAGLECGIIGEKYPGMEMVSIGPNMWDLHTPEEKVSISSSARFLDFLKAIIESL